MAEKTKRRGFLRFLGIGAAGAGATAVAGASTPAQAKPAPETVYVPVCNACPRIVMNQDGMFEEHICEQCRAGGVTSLSDGTVGAQSRHPVGSTGWAKDQIIAGHRVRQRCWKTGEGCELPQQMIEMFGVRYEKGVDTLGGLPTFTDMLWGMDWEIVP